MCLILFAVSTTSTHRLIVAANRDEFYHRPSLSAHFWDKDKHVLAGKDLEKQGTWLGVTKTGRFAAVTNFRKPDNKKYPQSRGLLTANFLEGNDTPEEYLQKIEKNQEQYAGFNLVIGNENSFCYYSNRSNASPKKLTPGIYGLSNHLLNTPWPKVTLGVSEFSQAISGSGSNTVMMQNRLLKVLQDEQQADDSLLPDTGVGVIIERMLSPRFIKSPSYGTRASSIIQIANSGEVNFLEQNYGASGEPREQLSFKLPSIEQPY